MVTDEPVPPPKPPTFSHWLAATLELGIVSVLIYHRSLAGLVLVAGYAWFSASWALFGGTKEK